MKTAYFKYKYLLIVLAGISVAACNKKLDLAPEGTLIENEALKDSSNTLGLIAGAYHQLWLASTGDVYTLGDLSTGIANSNFNRYITGAFDPRDQTIASFWDDNYATINLANVIIVKLPKLARFRKGLQEQFIGEAQFIRALSYFNLLKLFGDGALQHQMDNPGVPLRLQPFEGYDSTQNIPRSTNGEVYTQIIRDLEDAVVNLPASYNNDIDERIRATRSTAEALLSRVYLYMQDYDQCITACDKVLADDHYALQASVTDVFTDNGAGNEPYPFNGEMIFSFPSSYNNDPTQYAYNNFYYNYASTFAGADFVNSYADNDLRKTVLLHDVNGKLVPLKFSDPNDKDNVPVIRLAEIVLNKAEALARKDGVNQTSVDLLNEIHQRAFPDGEKPAPYTTGDFSGKEALIGRILQERAWELAFEGQDRFDKIRSGKQPGQIPADKYAFPVPQREIDITSGLIKQNAGYTD